VESTRPVPSQQVMCVILRHNGRFASGVSPPTNEKIVEVSKAEVAKSRSVEGPKLRRAKVLKGQRAEFARDRVSYSRRPKSRSE
jgi:hypothetical protein